MGGDDQPCPSIGCLWAAELWFRPGHTFRAIQQTLGALVLDRHSQTGLFSPPDLRSVGLR